MSSIQTYPRIHGRIYGTLGSGALTMPEDFESRVTRRAARQQSGASYFEYFNCSMIKGGLSYL